MAELSLFSDSDFQAPAAKIFPLSAAVSMVVDTVRALDAAAYRQGIAVCFSNPCKDCACFGLCDADDCAMHLFDLDVNDPYLDDSLSYGKKISIGH